MLLIGVDPSAGLQASGRDSVATLSRLAALAGRSASRILRPPSERYGRVPSVRPRRQELCVHVLACCHAQPGPARSSAPALVFGPCFAKLRPATGALFWDLGRESIRRKK